MRLWVTKKIVFFTFYDTLGESTIEYILEQTKLTSIALESKNLPKLLKLKKANKSSDLKHVIVFDLDDLKIAEEAKEAGLIVHSDRGSQYCSQVYRQHLEKHQLVCSMSRKGNCYDNAPIESFWGSLKNELINQKTYEYREKARAEIVEYIEIFYNRMRRHTKLGNISPAQAFSNYMKNAA